MWEATREQPGGPHHEGFWRSGFGWGPRNCFSNKKTRWLWCYCYEKHSWRERLLYPATQNTSEGRCGTSNKPPGEEATGIWPSFEQQGSTPVVRKFRIPTQQHENHLVEFVRNAISQAPSETYQTSTSISTRSPSDLEAHKLEKPCSRWPSRPSPIIVYCIAHPWLLFQTQF